MNNYFSIRTFRNFADTTSRAEGPFFLLERTEDWSKETPIKAHTLQEAQLFARNRVEQLSRNGWKCGAEVNSGTMKQATENTVAWLCQKHGPSKWISIKCGPLSPVQEDRDAHRHMGYVGGNFTAEKITEAYTSWAMFDGFSGEHCSTCLTDHNVMSRSPGFFCGRCGDYNCQSWSGHQMPHKEPEFGPTLAVIRAGFEQYRQNRRNRGEADLW